MYKAEDIIIDHNARRFRTKDGKYETHEDSKQFSYWYKNRGKKVFPLQLGSTAYDYVFFTAKGFEDALDTLNHILNNTCPCPICKSIRNEKERFTQRKD